MENNEVVYLYLDDIIPNRFQPREVFDDQALKELAVSIKEHGVIQPIIVRKVENKYEIIAGERRYKASTMAGLTKIPAIVKNLDDKESSKVALIENLQRRDLTPIEEARTYQKILELETGMTQEQLAQTMGKTQSVVSNKLRLLALPDEVQDALLKEKISERHARSLLNINNKNDQVKMLDKIIAERMTVRELDKEIKEMNDNQGQIAGNNDNGGSVLSMFDTIKGNFEFNTNINSNVSSSVNDNLSTGNFSNQSSTNSSSFNIGVDSNSNSSSQNFSSISNNPTLVDINKIRENAIDIGGVKSQTVDVKDLMKDTSSDKNSDFKFVPNDNETTNKTSFGIDNNLSSSTSNFGTVSFNSSVNPSSLNSSSTDVTSSFAGSSSTSNFNNTSVDSVPSVNFASSMNSSSPVFNLNSYNNPEKKDVTNAINDIKETIKNIETKGYNVLVEENDSDNTYQITIKVNKNY